MNPLPPPEHGDAADMPPLPPAAVQRLAQCGEAMAAAPHGQRTALLEAAAAEIGVSKATAWRHLRGMRVAPERRQRSDAGATSVTREEAAQISAVVMEAMRKNNKALMTVEHALDTLRYAGRVRCEAVDEATGEVRPLTARTVERALRLYGLHPKQLLRPAPHTELRSLHPNHVWEVDASLCVLFYLKNGKDNAGGLQVMRYDEFYKNKPRNLKRIENDRVWRYAITDHRSGYIFVHYVLGAESGMNLAESFMAAIQQRGHDPFYGVPHILMMDMGSANTGALFQNLCRRLCVRVIAHAPGNARATGQVENAHNIIERKFESSLRFKSVHSLDELNGFALVWHRWFNATKVHSRHGMTRAQAWMGITAEQLRIAPAPEVCRALLTHAPEPRDVSRTRTVSFGGAEYDVRAVPGIEEGAKVLVAINPWKHPQAVCIVERGAHGEEVLHDAPRVLRDAAGFCADAPVIGQSFAAHAKTRLEANREEVRRMAWGTADEKEVDKLRRGRELPFGGQFDPLAEVREAKLPAFLPRKGQEVAPLAQVAALQPAAPRVLSQFEAAAALASAAHLGAKLTPEQLALLRRLHPEGVPETELPALADQLRTRGALRVVQGGLA